MISLSRLLSRQIFSALLAVTSVFTLSSCHEHEEYADDGAGNFMQLWEIIDQHYCFFEEKDIDWAEVGRKYAAQLKDIRQKAEVVMGEALRLKQCDGKIAAQKVQVDQEIAELRRQTQKNKAIRAGLNES